MTNKNLSAQDFIKIISKIEREPENFDKMQKFLVDFALERSLSFKLDEFKNVVIYKNTCGSALPVALQTQADFLSVKTNKAKNFSFKNGVSLFKKGAYFLARKTNFGASSLAGMALILELLDSDIPVNVEAIFTANGDTMLGAKNLDIKNISSKQMICFDGFFDATLSSSSLNFAEYCVKFQSEKEFVFNSPELKTFHLSVFGLTNGLIGADFDATNTAKLLAELILKIENSRINNFTTKSQNEVVPNRTDCVFTTTLNDFSLKKIIRHFYLLNKKMNKNLQIKCSRQINQTLVLYSFLDALSFINEVEQGIVTDDERGIILQNLSEVDSENGTISVQILFSDEKLFKTQIKYLDDLCKKYGFSGAVVESRPRFKSLENSTLIKDLEESYVGIIPLKKVSLLSCSPAGVFQDKIKNLDIATINLCVENPFSTDEKLLFSSVKNTSLWLKNFFEGKTQSK